MSIKQTLFSILILGSFANNAFSAEVTTPASDKKITALVMSHETTTDKGWFFSTPTYTKNLHICEDDESAFQALEKAYGYLECDCNIPGFPKTMKLYHHYDDLSTLKNNPSLLVGCEEFISRLKSYTPEKQKHIAESLSANQ